MAVHSNICQYLYQDMFFIHVENHIIIIVLLRKIYAMLFTETFLMLLEHNEGNQIVFEGTRSRNSGKV